MRQALRFDAPAVLIILEVASITHWVTTPNVLRNKKAEERQLIYRETVREGSDLSQVFVLTAAYFWDLDEYANVVSIRGSIQNEKIITDEKLIPDSN